MRLKFPNRVKKRALTLWPEELYRWDRDVVHSSANRKVFFFLVIHGPMGITHVLMSSFSMQKLFTKLMLLRQKYYNYLEKKIKIIHTDI